MPRAAEVEGLDDRSRRIVLALDMMGVALLALMAIVQIFPPNYGSKPAVLVGVIGIAAVGAACVIGQRGQATSCYGVSLAGLLLAYYVFAGAAYVWPLHLLVPLGITFIHAWKMLGEEAFHMLHMGRYDRRNAGFVIAIALVVGACLSTWLHFSNPDLSSYREMLPNSIGGLLITGLAFSIVNSVLEEVVWRGILLGWLTRSFPLWVAVAIQALSFGAAHWNGFPSRLTGAALATLFGAILGLTSLRLGGLLVVTAAHAVVDAIVFAMLANKIF